jgi:hypothetical protein
MKLPSKKRPGNPILASDWNTLIDALAARTPQPGTGAELVFSSGGFTYRVRKTSASDAGAASCANLKVFSSTPEGQTIKRLFVGVGSVGTVVFDEDEDLGPLDGNKEKLILAKITLDGQDGTYEAELVALADAPEPTETISYFLLGSVNKDGAISQHGCGPVSVTVCRNWYASEAPYFGMTIAS